MTVAGEREKFWVPPHRTFSEILLYLALPVRRNEHKC